MIDFGVIWCRYGFAHFDLFCGHSAEIDLARNASKMKEFSTHSNATKRFTSLIHDMDFKMLLLICVNDESLVSFKLF